ncbi:hypothetical protein AX17_000501 [Amanita inopinata Kibby_2008]|nr:hypothetical protein AX17_000501 [Amanita inopinata Kibby_2008]
MGSESRQEASAVHYHHVQQPSTSSSPLSQRRRSLAYTRSPVPPPSIPIPSVPDHPQDTFPVRRSTSDSSELPYSISAAVRVNGSVARPTSYARPGASPNLTNIAAFSQNINVPFSNPIPTMSSIPVEDLSDPPPQSFLLSSPKNAERRHRQSGEDALLSTTNAERRERPPSSRSALTRALELARQAVHLDSTNDNPAAAVEAYGQSVALLSQVMERVKRGEDGGRRTRSPEAQEEEVRRLQNIHDTYADRMNILSIIYSIPAAPYTTPSTHAPSTTPSPTTSGSSSSNASPHISLSNQPQSESRHYPDGRIGHSHEIDSGETMREAMFPIDDAPSTGPIPHPYANQYDSPQEWIPPTPQNVPARGSIGPTTRRRAASNLPPPTPPPIDSLPPAPASIGGEHKSMPSEHVGHRRNGSGRLARLEEKDEGQGDGQASFFRQRSDSSGPVPPTPRNPKRESPPLPPIPPPEPNSFDANAQVRTVPRKTPPSPRLSNAIVAQRPRAASQLQNRSDTPNYGYINSSPKDGAIFLRRTQTSAPSSTRSSSPTDSSVTMGRPAASSLPGSTITLPTGGRIRSSSQPGRKPTGQMSPSEQRPPLPSSSGQNGVLRKVSIPSKLNPNASSFPLTVQTDLLSPTGSGSIIQTNPIQTTPTSPLPPAPPTDSLRKPYHMMNLLRVTMTSITGGYVTRRLHVPFEVWSQGGAKLANVPEKIRVVEILSSALEDLQTSSSEYFGAGNVSSGLAMGIGSVGRKEAEGWFAKLDDFCAVCDGIEANFGKKLGVGEGFVPKKNALAGLAKKIDKFTNGKNLDSPTLYVHGLKVLFQHAQLLDEHTQAVVFVSPAYAAFPMDVRTSAEQKLRRSSEFFATVILTFVIRDLSQLLDKYVKKCEKWLAE